MVGDISIGEYHLFIQNVSAATDDAEYDCQAMTKDKSGKQIQLRSNKAKINVQGNLISKLFVNL